MAPAWVLIEPEPFADDEIFGALFEFHSARVAEWTGRRKDGDRSADLSPPFRLLPW